MCAGLLTHDTQIYLTNGDAREAAEQEGGAPTTTTAAAADAAAADAAAAEEDAGRDDRSSSSSSSNGGGSEAGEADLLPQSLAAVRGSVVLLNVRQAGGLGRRRRCEMEMHCQAIRPPALQHAIGRGCPPPT